MTSSIWLQLLLQAALIAVNAFFAASEIAVIELNASKLRKQVQAGDKAAARMLKMVEEPSDFLSTIQIAITLAGFLGSAFAAENFSSRLVSWVTEDLGFTAISSNVLDIAAVVLITLILSYFTLVLGELVPKRIAMQKPYHVAKATSGVIRCVAAVVKPVIWLLSASTNGILRLLRLKTTAREEEVTEDEIRMMVDIGEEKGAIQTEEKELIDNIFEFNNSTARDVMTHSTEIIFFDINRPREELLSLFSQSGRSRIPVVDGDLNHLLGIVTIKDYCLQPEKPLRDILLPAYCVPETVPADVLFRDLQRKKTHMAIVVDEYGETSGLLTLEDLLEEIVGDIYDESDGTDEAPIRQVGENLWRVAGNADIEAVFEALNMEAPEDLECDTLNGLVLQQLTAIPDEGSTLDVDASGLHIHVEQVRNRKVEAALVGRAETEKNQEENKEEKLEQK